MSYNLHEQSLNELLPIAKRLYTVLLNQGLKTEAMAEYERFDTKYKLRHGRTVTQQIESLPPYDWADDPDLALERDFDDEEARRAAQQRHPANALQEGPRRQVRRKGRGTITELHEGDVAGTIRRASAEAHVEGVEKAAEEGEETKSD